MKTLISLLEDIEYVLEGDKSLLSSMVSTLAFHSSKVQFGTAFFCLIGAHTDGHTFAEDAYNKGARIFFCERTLNLCNDTLQIIVKNCRAALASVSAAFFDHPEKNLTLIGVTGTKGKSTICEMISHIFAHSGKKCAVICTLGIKIDGRTEETDNSTPESFIIYKALSKIAALNIRYVAIEVSSQALCTHRVDGLRFSAAVFTNLSRDHIGTYEHPNFAHYKEAKKSLFTRAEMAFINTDDLFGSEFYSSCRCPVQTYGKESNAYFRLIRGTPFQAENLFGIKFSFACAKKNATVKLPLPGDFSALNALAAIAVCHYFGISITTCTKALESVNICGRFEQVSCARKDITCIIDYAHNADSLEKSLCALHEYANGRIICVFGSVGGRTRERRRGLAEVCSRLADVCIVTVDNPDFESPEMIVSEIASYINPEKCVAEPDRAKAIALALDMAKSGDFLLFAGKGHETYQLVRGKKLPFSERELIENHIFKNLQKSTV